MQFEQQQEHQHQHQREHHQHKTKTKTNANNDNNDDDNNNHDNNKKQTKNRERDRTETIRPKGIEKTADICISLAMAAIGRAEQSREETPDETRKTRRGGKTIHK